MKLSAATEAWVQSRARQGFEPPTVKNDRNRMRRFIREMGDMEVGKVTDIHVEEFYDQMAPTNGSGTLANYHYTFKVFFKFCRHRGYCRPGHDPVAEHRAPKYRATARNILHVSKFPALLEAAGARHPRDRALMALGLFTLARASEIVPLRVRDLNLDQGELPMYQRKTNTHDNMAIPRELDDEMRRWLIDYAALTGRPIEPNWHLVPSRVAGPNDHVRGPDGMFQLNRAGVVNPETKVGHPYDIARLHLEAIGFPIYDENGKTTREGMHTLRRSGSRALFDELRKTGYDAAMRMVQTMLHHSTMAQTERYLQITPDKDQRNRLLRGEYMYPSNQSETVVRLEDRRHG